MARKKRMDKFNDDVKIDKNIKVDNHNKKEEVIKVDKKVDMDNHKKRENAVNKSKLIPQKEASKNIIYKHPVTNFILIVTLLSSVCFFILGLFYDNVNPIDALIRGLILVIFCLTFVAFSMTVNKKNKTLIGISSLLLLGYFIYGSLMTIGIINFSNKIVIDFTNMELTEVIKWSEENKVSIIQDYEYSDLIEEYHIITQNVKAGTKIKDVKDITISISDGPNPSKEVVIPNMVGWDSERILKFINDNHLSNVEVEFMDSIKEANTVVEQTKSGNMKRDDYLKLIFSYGAEIGFEQIKLRDLSGLSKFEATFYLKQNYLNYEFEEVFSSKIKKGFVVKQSIDAGEMVRVNDQKIIVSISKGPEIKIPNLNGMTMTEITDWVIKNKLKLEFSDKYDDSIEENSVISANYKEGEIVAEGSEIAVVISRGKLIMPKFENYNEFKDWAEKYQIKYEEQREFSNNVAAGEVIRYSYNAGDTIRNNDPVVVTVSNGKEAVVPNVIGLTKDAAASKLRSARFGYSFVYSYSNSVASGKVIKQSIGSGSKVVQGTTITLTISNGPKPEPPKPVCNPVSVTIQSSLNGSSVAQTSANYKAAYPNVNFRFIPKASNIGTTGMVHPDTAQKVTLSGTTCSEITIYIIQN